MQFNNRISVVYNTLNDFSEPEGTEEKALRCCIIEQRKRAHDDDGKKLPRYDLKFLVSSRAFAPYKDLFNSDTLTFKRNGIVYELVVIAGINDFSGNVKYYEVELREIK